MAVLSWRVTINKRWTYYPDAINAAEASSEAVRSWRKDEAVPLDARRDIVAEIHTRVL